MNCSVVFERREWSAPAQPPTEGAEGAAPGGGPPGPPPNMTSNRRLQQTQAQVEEVVDIMRVNVDKVLERDQKLSELDDRADALQAGASQFESSAAKLKRKYWWKNCKMMIMLGAICAIIVVVIVRGHRQRRTTTGLDVSQAWSKPALLGRPVTGDHFWVLSHLSQRESTLCFWGRSSSTLFLIPPVPSSVFAVPTPAPHTHVHKHICT
uniref:Vesicle associated membrane protein 1 n=1 Tax=Capra hircus TaxID=9925 RepID=A0A8C2NDS9_CAPHI